MNKPIELLNFIRYRIQPIFLGSIKAWIAQRAASKGAALAFYALFSMAPILLLLISIAGSIFGTEATKVEILNQLSHFIDPMGVKAIELLLANAPNPQTGRLATWIASVMLFIGATSVFGELKESLDEIWQVNNVKSGLYHALKKRVKSFGLVLFLAFMLMVSMVMSAILSYLNHYWEGRWSSVVLLLPLSNVFSFSVITSLFAVIYKMLPYVRLSWKDVSIGAFGTALLFMLGKLGIGFYLTSGHIATSYGAAGSLIVLLLWVYYSAQIFFFGALFTQQYALLFGSLKNSSHSLKNNKK